jgi:capsular exopolysaccharide synthesis family protein
MQMGQGEWDVYKVLEALRRRIVLVLLCIFLVPLAAVALSLIQEKQYTATSALLFRDPGFDQELFGTAVLLPQTDSDREAATNLRLVSLETVDRLVANRLGISAEDVREKVDVQAEGNSDIVTIEATDPDPDEAARLANVVGEEYVAFRRDADRAKILEAKALIEQGLEQLPSGAAATARQIRLERRLDELETLASLQTGNAEVVERAEVPTSPSSPRIVRNAALGLLLGVVLAAALALILHRVDRRIREPDELQELFDLPILGYVPETANLRKDASRPHLRGREGEAFRMLRTSLLYFNVDKDLRSLLVTSSAPAEGKTTVSWNLACAAAAGGSDVLLIEADLRHPTLASHVGESARGVPGLGEILAGDLDPREGVIQAPIAPPREGYHPPGVDVILAGAVPPNPADLLESRRMRRLLEDAQDEYDLVIIDTPPTFVVPDAVPLIKQVSGVLVVARIGMTTRDTARQLSVQLKHLEAPTLGLVVNSIEQWRERYSYAYVYEGSSYGNGAGDDTSRGGLGRLRGRRGRADAETSSTAETGGESKTGSKY